LKYDLIIKGGFLVDPSQGLNEVRDVAFAEGKVAAIKNLSDGDAPEVIDATGLIVTPGLLDLHVHVFPGVSHFGIDPDHSNIGKGVTTAVDAGSAGALTFPFFRKHIIETADTRLYSLLNISSTGMISPKVGELEDIRLADVEAAVAAGRTNSDLIVGIKARLSRSTAGENDVAALERALEAAEALGVFVMIHVGGTRTPMEKLVNMLRPGDVVTHSYHGNDYGILDDAGRVIEGIREAQRKGVIFDVGHGAGSFSFDVAEKALSQGFDPGNISSDLHFYNIEGPVFDQVTTISKFMWLGMSLEDVVRLTTESTAGIIGAEGLGSLKIGSIGDATILRCDEGKFLVTDSVGRSVTAKEKLVHIQTIKSGRVYRPWR
jgi:dihydroorotase